MRRRRALSPGSKRWHTFFGKSWHSVEIQDIGSGDWWDKWVRKVTALSPSAGLHSQLICLSFRSVGVLVFRHYFGPLLSFKICFLGLGSGQNIGFLYPRLSSWAQVASNCGFSMYLRVWVVDVQIHAQHFRLYSQSLGSVLVHFLKF